MDWCLVAQAVRSMWVVLHVAWESRPLATARFCRCPTDRQLPRMAVRATLTVAGVVLLLLDDQRRIPRRLHETEAGYGRVTLRVLGSHFLQLLSLLLRSTVREYLSATEQTSHSVGPVSGFRHVARRVPRCSRHRHRAGRV